MFVTYVSNKGNKLPLLWISYYFSCLCAVISKNDAVYENGGKDWISRACHNFESLKNGFKVKEELQRDACATYTWDDDTNGPAKGTKFDMCFCSIDECNKY